LLFGYRNRGEIQRKQGIRVGCSAASFKRNGNREYMGLAKKIFLCMIFASPVFSYELVCASDFEIIGLNVGYGKYSVKELQSKMNVKANSRQLLVADSVFATYDIEHQMSLAKKRMDCSYLLQITLMRLEESVQVNVRLIDLKSKNYVLRKFYKADSPTDLPLIFEQIGNALQEPEFAKLEQVVYPNASVRIKDSPKRKDSYMTYSIGYFDSQKWNQQDMLKFNMGYFWDSNLLFYNTRFWGEAFVGYGAGMEFLYEFGFRILYPFSKNSTGFYSGSGCGFSHKSSDYNASEYALFVENTVSFLILRSSIWRFEASIAAFFYDEPIVGGGLRIVGGWGI
jgi:hypothetical protein